MEKRLLHIHFGAGPLGLGLVLEQSDPTATRFILCNRFVGSTSPLTAHAAKTNRVRIRVGDEPVEVRSFDEFVATDDPKGVKRIWELLQSDEPVVITVAVNQGQPDIAALLTGPLQRREEVELPGATVLICENRPHPVWQELGSALKETRVITDVVVDRICRVASTGAHPIVETERYFEWRAASG